MDQLSSIKIAKSKVKVQGILMMLVAAICFAAVAILIKLCTKYSLNGNNFISKYSYHVNNSININK